MRIRSSNILAVLLTAISWQAKAQVLSPAEIMDPAMRELQQSHLEELHAITAGLAGHHFPYRFYFSRRLDISEREQERSDQRSIQFDRFRGQTVLKITGNYFAAYSAERMTNRERARQTFRDVMLPILQQAAPALARAKVPDAFALEISHHVIRKVLGVDTESAENVVLILPKASAQRLLEAPDETARAAAVLQGTAYLNGSPISFWPGDVNESLATQRSTAPVPPQVTTDATASTTAPVPPRATTDATASTAAPVPPRATTDATASTAAPVPPRATTDETAPTTAPPAVASPPAISDTPKKLEADFSGTLARMVKELDSQAHFVPYAPPSFIAFRGGQYLQIPITTTLKASDSGSQYKLAALAFDRHVAHLIRPVLAYFKDNDRFTGIDFSTTVRLAGLKVEAEEGEAVEFIIPMAALRGYEQFNLTGQQLLDAGVVLINGERVGLGLQAAEAGGAPLP